MEQASNVKQFLKLLERYKVYSGVFFRGQSEKYSTITSSISRDIGYYQNEHLIYAETISMKRDEFEVFNSPIERLSKMQHYGIPTRLIDVTVNPLIALFFAVQNTNDKYSGNVYVFIQKEHPLHSKHVRLLALLATLSDYSINEIKKTYTKYYEDNISEEEILLMVQEPAFVEYTEALKNTNSRLFNQKGTFAVCGNEVINGVIQKKIKPLDKVCPVRVIRIPYEYKLSVKRELDEHYGINKPIIYPELPSVADYIKEKYKSENLNIDGTFSIVEVKDISHLAVKRISIKIVLEKTLQIHQIKQIGKSIIDKYTENNDVVWIYIAKNGDDYIMNNWILRGQWISDKLDDKFRPLPIGKPDGNGYYWDHSKSYSTLADYYSQYVFDDDKNLYVYYEKVYSNIKTIYNNLYTAFQSMGINEFASIVNKHKKTIHEAFMLFGEFGRSKNKEFDDYLDNYQQVALQLDKIQLWVKRNDLNERAKHYQIFQCFQYAKKHVDIIDHKSSKWMKRLNVTEADFNRIDPQNRSKNDYQYRSTLPLNPNALIVEFDVDICKNSDNTFRIKGKTNLFDKAILMLSVRDMNGKLQGQSKAEVNDGCFDFGVFSNKGSGYSSGKYKAEISLSIPNVQPKEFVQKAGIEYENLAGEYMDRTGFGPTLKYEKEFII